MRSFGAISDAVDALFERGDTAEWRDVLQGCRYEPEAFSWDGDPVGDIVAGPSFNATKSSQRRWLDHAMRVVIARAPERFADAAALRDEVTSLCLRTAAADAGAHTDFEPLVAFQNLAWLLLRRVNETLNLDAVARMPALTRLRFEDGGIDDLTPLAGAPHLESLDLDRLSNLASLTALASLPALRRLRLGRVKGLASLAALSELRALESLTLEVEDGASGVVDLRDLASLGSLRRLSLVGFTSLVDVSSLASLSSLEELSLAGATALVDVSSLAKARSLRAIDLSGCGAVTDVSSLAGLAVLRALLLKASGVGTRAIPPALREVATARKDATMRELLADAAAREALAARPVELDPRNHSAWSKLAPLLFAKEPDNVDLGVELVASFNDPTLFDAIFYDVRWVSPAPRVTRPWNLPPLLSALVPDATTVLPRSPAALRDRALLSLLALAPEGATRARALRDEAVAVDFDGYIDPMTMVPIDVRPLAKLPNVERVSVTRTREIVGLDLLAHTSKLREIDMFGGHVRALGAHRHLRSLSLRTVTLDDASGIPLATELESLSLEGVNLPRRVELRDLSRLATLSIGSPGGLSELALASLPSLREVKLSYVARVAVIEVRACPSLSSLTLTYFGGRRFTFEALPSLSQLSITGVMQKGAFEGLEGLEGLTALEDVKIVWCEAELKPLLERLPEGVKSITLDHAGQLVDLSAFARFTRLETLRVRDMRLLNDISALSSLPTLRTLEFEHCPQLADARPIEALPSLRALTLSGCGVKRAKLSPRLQSLPRAGG